MEGRTEGSRIAQARRPFEGHRRRDCDLQENQRQSSAKEKALREQLKPAKCGSIATAARGSRSVIVSTSYTGRVKTAAPIFGTLFQLALHRVVNKCFSA